MQVNTIEYRSAGGKATWIREAMMSSGVKLMLSKTGSVSVTQPGAKRSSYLQVLDALAIGNSEVSEFLSHPSVIEIVGPVTRKLQVSREKELRRQELFAERYEALKDIMSEAEIRATIEIKIKEEFKQVDDALKNL